MIKAITRIFFTSIITYHISTGLSDLFLVSGQFSYLFSQIGFIVLLFGPSYRALSIVFGQEIIVVDKADLLKTLQEQMDDKKDKE